MTDLRTLADAFNELERRADHHDENPHLVAIASRRRRVSTHRLALAAASIGLVLLIAAGVVLLGRGERHPASDAAGPTASPNSSAPAGISAPLRAALWQVAEALGRENGDEHIQAQAVLTSAGAAQKIDLGSPTESQLDRPVWIIQITGNFSCGGCSVADGAATPRGKVVDLVLDAASPSLGSGQSVADEIGGFSIGGHPVDLAALGPVVTLSAPPSAVTAPQTPTPSPTGTVAVLSNDAADSLADLKAGLNQSKLGVEVVRHPGQRLDVVLTGSSTCIPSVVSATQTASDAVTIVVHPCTGGGLADLKTSDTVATFARLGDDHPARVTVLVTGQGTADWTLPAAG